MRLEIGVPQKVVPLFPAIMTVDRSLPGKESGLPKFGFQSLPVSFHKDAVLCGMPFLELFERGKTTFWGGGGGVRYFEKCVKCVCCWCPFRNYSKATLKKEPPPNNGH